MGIQRACELATSFPLSISDDDVTTPFARDLADIASVSLRSGGGGGGGKADRVG